MSLTLGRAYNRRKPKRSGVRAVKVEVLQENLQRGLSLVGRAVATRSTLPITGNVLLATDRGRLKLAATDLELSIRAWVGAKVDEEGATTVPARLLADFVATLPPAPVTLEIPERGRQLRLTCARNESSMNTMDADDFPRIASISDGTALSVESAALRKAIERVEFAAASDESRPVLTGVHMKASGDRLTLAAADGFRLAVADIPLASPPEPFEIIVPARALRELSRLLGDAKEPVEIRVNAQRNQVQFTLTDVEMVAQLVQGTFPHYAQLIPSEWNTRVTVPVDDFRREVRGAAIFARDGSGIVRLYIHAAGEGPARLVVSARAEEVGTYEGEIDAEVEGESSRIAFNARYLQDVLAVLQDRVSLEMTSPSAQGVFRNPSDPTYVHVVMPMFVQW